VGDVALVAFVEGNNEQATGLESRAGDEWGNIGLQPGIGLGERAVMPSLSMLGAMNEYWGRELLEMSVANCLDATMLAACGVLP